LGREKTWCFAFRRSRYKAFSVFPSCLFLFVLQR
jgi:hypothetical protein